MITIHILTPDGINHRVFYGQRKDAPESPWDLVKHDVYDLTDVHILLRNGTKYSFYNMAVAVEEIDE